MLNILITGARKGIGYATALELLDRGHFVYLTVHTSDQLSDVKNRDELKGKTVECLKLDITNAKDRQKVKDLNIDVLINNAAIGLGGSIIEADMDRIRDNYEVNFFGTIELTKVFLSDMVKRDSGRIIMISSILGEMPFPWFGIYSSTKAALTNISMALDSELKEIKSNVKVSIIEPGFYKTGFNDNMIENKYDNESSIFKNYREEINKRERMKVSTLESTDLKSIVDKIVAAVEDKKPQLIYKAPFIQAVAEKAYVIKNK